MPCKDSAAHGFSVHSSLNEVNAVPLLMHRDVAQFIERMGLLWEQEGLTRIAGRIFGLALVSPDPCSLDEIAEALGVSKASVSNDARMLEKLGFVERVSLPGDRRDYYRITRDSIVRSLSTKLQRLRVFQDVMSDARTLPIKNADVRQRIEAHDVAHRAIIEALEGALAELKDRPQLSSARSSRT